MPPESASVCVTRRRLDSVCLIGSAIAEILPEGGGEDQRRHQCGPAHRATHAFLRGDNDFSGSMESTADQNRKLTSTPISRGG